MPNFRRSLSFPPSSLPPSLPLSVIDCGEEGLTPGGSGVFENGEVDIPSPTTFGAVATYRCDGNYLLNGNEQRTCEVGGWSGSIPLCGTLCLCSFVTCFMMVPGLCGS